MHRGIAAKSRVFAGFAVGRFGLQGWLLRLAGRESVRGGFLHALGMGSCAGARRIATQHWLESSMVKSGECSIRQEQSASAARTGRERFCAWAGLVRRDFPSADKVRTNRGQEIGNAYATRSSGVNILFADTASQVRASLPSLRMERKPRQRNLRSPA